MVYVISKTGQPIMPTENHAKVRMLLKSGKAEVVKRTPFTIQLTGTSKTFTQEITLGVDAGSKHVGLSASTTKNLLCGCVASTARFSSRRFGRFLRGHESWQRWKTMMQGMRRLFFLRENLLRRWMRLEIHYR